MLYRESNAINNFIHGCNRLYVSISFLITTFLAHGYCPDSVSSGTMTPIAKVNGTTDSNNFRVITLCSIICKLFEVVVQKKCQDIFKTFYKKSKAQPLHVLRKEVNFLLQ